jgi:hypothetical protein
MKERPDIIHEVRLWIEKAEHDLLAAKHSMLLADRGLTDIVCFHCRQCAEKFNVENRVTATLIPQFIISEFGKKIGVLG